MLRAADWYLGPISAASGIFLTCSPEHYLFCFSQVQILPSPPVHIPHPMLTHLLLSASLLTLTQLPHALVSLSVTVYTIPVVTSSLLTIPFLFSSFSSLFISPFFCFPPSLPPLAHYPPFPSFLAFNSTFPFCFSSSFPFLIFSSFNISPFTITHLLHHSFIILIAP